VVTWDVGASLEDKFTWSGLDPGTMGTTCCWVSPETYDHEDHPGTGLYGFWPDAKAERASLVLWELSWSRG
jgi:hypothetical protein